MELMQVEPASTYMNRVRADRLMKTIEDVWYTRTII